MPLPWLAALSRYHHRAALAGIALVAATSWAAVIAMALPGSRAAMVHSHGSLHAVMLFSMWTVMMAAMMLPGAAPMLLLFQRVRERQPDAGSTGRAVAAFAAGYLVVWTLFSAAATLAQLALDHAGTIAPDMALDALPLAGSLLIVVGLYQLTPWKHACLARCRSPLEFLAHHWRDGIAGAFRMGLAHGRYCLGCCWALMLLLFAGGVMNPIVIGALTLYVAAEKLAPGHGMVSRLGAAALILAGGALCAGGVWSG
jgi:predicted metal-binding membrane protein